MTGFAGLCWALLGFGLSRSYFEWLLVISSPKHLQALPTATSSPGHPHASYITNSARFSSASLSLAYISSPSFILSPFHPLLTVFAYTRRPLPPFHRRHFSETAEALLRPTSHQHLFTNPSLSFSHTEHVIRKEEVMASARDASYAGRVVRARTSRHRWCLGQKAVCCGDRSNSKSDLKRLSSFQHA